MQHFLHLHRMIWELSSGAVGRNPMVVTFLEQLCAAVVSSSSGSGGLSVNVELWAGHWPGHWVGHWTLFLESVLAAR